MSDEKHEHPITEYPGGLTERPGGPVPNFLKLTYVGFIIFGFAYLFLYLSGDGSELVELYNKLTAG